MEDKKIAEIESSVISYIIYKHLYPYIPDRGMFPFYCRELIMALRSECDRVKELEMENAKLKETTRGV